MSQINPQPRKWILIVDDEPEIREKIKTFIELNYRDSIKIAEASDGVEATSRIHFKAFDVIITDIRMPRKEGTAFIKSVRESQLNAKTPIIVLTAFPEEPITAEFVQIIEKPSSLDEISKSVANQLKLGSTENRISADILNCFVESTQLFYSTVVKSESNIEKPDAKLRGTQVNGDFHCITSIKSGSIVNRFVIGFSKGVLERALPKELNSNPDSYDRAAKAALQVLLKKVVLKIGASKAQILKAEVISVKGPLESQLREQTGIAIPISSPYGSTHVYAVWDSPRS